MKRCSVLLLAAMAAACGWAAAYPDFQTGAYRLEGISTSVDGAARTRTVIYRDGMRMRVETTLPQLGPAVVVFDEAHGGAYALNPAGAPATQILTETGVAVRIDDADAPQPLETAWAALGAENVRNVGGCRVAGERGREWAPRDPPAPNVERSACITRDGIVLRVTENGRVLWEATSLERGPQQAALFGIPPGYLMLEQGADAPPAAEIRARGRTRETTAG